MLARQIRPSGAIGISIGPECSFCTAQLARNFHSTSVLHDETPNPSSSDPSSPKSPSIKTGARQRRAAEAFNSIQNIQRTNRPVGLRGGVFRSGQVQGGVTERPRQWPAKQENIKRSPESRSKDDAVSNEKQGVQIRKVDPTPQTPTTDSPQPRRTNFKITRTPMSRAAPPRDQQRPPRQPRQRSRAPRAARPQRGPASEQNEEEKLMRDFWAAPHKYDPMPERQRALLASGAVQKPVFKPLPIEQETLVTNRIATAAGEDGLKTEVVSAMARLARRPVLDWTVDADLARRLCHGEVLKFSSDEERERITMKAELFAEKTAAKISKRKGEEVVKEDVGFVPVGGEMRERIVDKVLKGRYVVLARPEAVRGREATIGQVEAALRLNGSYTTGKGKTVLDMVKAMWPREKRAAAAA